MNEIICNVVVAILALNIAMSLCKFNEPGIWFPLAIKYVYPNKNKTISLVEVLFITRTIIR